MWENVAKVDPQSGEVSWPFDCLIYLHGSTCETDIGLTLTLAHELQHFLQYVLCRPLWAINTLLMNLPDLPRHNLQAWKDFPLERESRIIAKQVAERVFGQSSVSTHIHDMIEAHLTDQDAADWAFIREIDCSVPYDPLEGTRQLVEGYRHELKQLQKQWPRDRDISSVNLDDWKSWAAPVA
jgi:hypothetical protein